MQNLSFDIGRIIAAGGLGLSASLAALPRDRIYAAPHTFPRCNALVLALSVAWAGLIFNLLRPNLYVTARDPRSSSRAIVSRSCCHGSFGAGLGNPFAAIEKGWVGRRPAMLLGHRAGWGPCRWWSWMRGDRPEAIRLAPRGPRLRASRVVAARP